MTLNFPISPAPITGDTFRANGITYRFSSAGVWLPSGPPYVAAYNFEDQLLEGGARISTKALPAGSLTVKPGERSLFSITNAGAFTVTAPTQDGACVLLITNAVGAGAVTFSGFSYMAEAGDLLNTNFGERFAVQIWRINGVSGYHIAAMGGVMFPGDLGISFTAWWGLRAFSRATIGNTLVRLRRDSDDATLDVGSLADGKLDTASIIAFKGTAANLKVVQFFDQSGNGYHVSPPAGQEQAFVLNALNGMGVYDNSVNNAARYGTSQNLNFDMYSISAYAVYRTTSPTWKYQTLFGSFQNEVGLAATPNFNTRNESAIKNEGATLGDTYIRLAATDNQWHAVGGTVNQAVGLNSFFNVDNVVSNTKDLSGPFGEVGAAKWYIFGDEGNSGTNQLVGQGAEVGWLATQGTPWTVAQVQELIARAQSFWKI